MHRTGARAALVFVNGDDRLRGPAEGGRPLDEGVLPLGTLLMAAHLLRTRLANIDERLPPQMGWRDFALLGRSGSHHATSEVRRPWRTRTTICENRLPKACLVSSGKQRHTWGMPISCAAEVGGDVRG